MPAPAWLVAAVDQRLALLEEKFSNIPLTRTLVMSPLEEPLEGATEEEYQQWERSCSHCKVYCPPETKFRTGHAEAMLKSGTPVLLCFGVCPDHFFE